MYISLRCLSWFTEIHVKLISEKVVQVLHMNQNLVSFLCSSFESPKSRSTGHTVMGSEKMMGHVMLITPRPFPGFQFLYYQEELRVSKNIRKEGEAVNLSWPVSPAQSSGETAEVTSVNAFPTSFNACHPKALRSSPVKIHYEMCKLSSSRCVVLIPWKLCENLLGSSRLSVHGDGHWWERKGLQFVDYFQYTFLTNVRHASLSL